MRTEQLKRFEEAPEKGQLLAYTRKKVLFQAYDGKESVKQLLAGEDLLELHLFDGQKEYRSIVSESSRYETGIIECVEDFPEDEESVYREECVTDDGKGSLIVLNHIRYDESGMAQADTYRLVMGGNGNE